MRMDELFLPITDCSTRELGTAAPAPCLGCTVVLGLVKRERVSQPQGQSERELTLPLIFLEVTWQGCVWPLSSWTTCLVWDGKGVGVMTPCPQQSGESVLGSRELVNWPCPLPNAVLGRVGSALCIGRTVRPALVEGAPGKPASWVRAWEGCFCAS